MNYKGNELYLYNGMEKCMKSLENITGILAQLDCSVDDLVDGGLLVTGTGDNVLVVGRDVAAEH